jgi:hypothetical protein
MAKKLKKGNLITELVKGSLEYTRDWIVQQFRRQFPYSETGPNYYIVDSFADHVVVESYHSPELMPSEFFQVPFTKSGDTYTFAPREQWEIVELTYQPQTRASEVVAAESRKEERGKKKGTKFNERVNAQVVLEEREEGKPRRIKIEGAITANVVNGNKRRYPAEVVRSAVEELRSHLNESAGQGRAIQILGEAEHPSDKGGRPNLLETVTKWDEVAFDGTRVDLTGRIMETSKGKDILTLMEGGVMPGVSLRGYGEGKSVGKGDEKVFEVTELHITGFDLVLEPSFENVAQLIESINPEGEFDMNELLEQLKKLLAENPELFNKGMTEAQLEAMNDKQLKKLEESLRTALGIDANANIIESVKANADKARKYDELQAKQGIEAAITEATKDLPFGEKLNKVFTESFAGMEFTNVAEVKKFAETQKKQFSQLAAAGVLKGMGFVEGKTIGVKGPVLESETGTPEFARASFELSESIRRVEMSDARNWNKPVSLNEKYTKMLLDRFDAQHKQKLVAESKLFEEAETTSDLNLPYSVSRALIEEAFPSLVAAGIFDVGIMNASPELLYFETFTGESGYTGSVANEVVTGGAEGVWYALDHGRITPGTVVVTSNPAGTTYVEDEDYQIDYAAGRIRFLTAGDIGANDVLVDYDYTAIRQGEMAPIERGKITLSSMTIQAAADRLADQISREAIVFSRSQMGLDVVARTMSNLIKQLRRKIDQGIIYAALKAVKSLGATNSGGTWVEGFTQEDYAELVRLIGATKLIVRNRYYAPTFILASATNAETLSNWEGFKRDGFPDALLTAAGFVGNVKGLPLFESTEMPDGEIIVGNRQLVAHRVFQPALINGPYPTYDVSGGTSKLVAADQYYVEEFNNTEVPVEEKGAYLSISEGS